MRKISKKRQERLKLEAGEKELMWTLFLEIWKKRPHKSEVSEKWLGNEPLTVYFHHILPKETYPERRLDEDNIILLTPEEHDNVHIDMYRYEKINRRRAKLLG